MLQYKASALEPCPTSSEHFPFQLPTAVFAKMGVRLFGMSTSTCTKRVAVVATEIGVPYELVAIDVWSNEQKAPEYLEKRPFGQVPYIVSTPKSKSKFCP
jgi:glutaredoxin